jgi:hypothetical protein
MALNYQIGAVQWLSANVAGTTYAVTGLGFAPKALKFYCIGLQSTTNTTSANTIHERNCIGFAVSPTSRRAVACFGIPNAASANCGSVLVNDCAVTTVDEVGAIIGKLDINSFDSNGFTLIVDATPPANLTVFWEAWGGSDITVAEVGDIAEPAATGTVNYTVTGFTADGANQVVMFAGCQSTAAAGTGQATDSGLCVGVATSTAETNQWVSTYNSDDGSASSDTDWNQNKGNVLQKITIGGGNVNSYASLSAWGTNLFTLNWGARATTNRRNIFLAIKGGQWSANNVNISNNTIGNTATVSGLPFTPLGGSVVYFGGSANAPPPGISGTNAYYSCGMFTSTTNRQCVYQNQPDGQANMVINLGLAYNAVGAVTAGSGLLDIDQFISGGFIFIIDANSWFSGSGDIMYLTFGSQTPARIPRTTSVGHPFII